MTNDLITRFAEKQKRGWHLCPRCGCDRMSKDATRNALSRRADIYICDTCGAMEAIEDYPCAEGVVPVTPASWVLSEYPERYFMRGEDYTEFFFTFGTWEGFPFPESYILVEGFDRDDAVSRFRQSFPDKKRGEYLPAVPCYSLFFTHEEWEHGELAKHNGASHYAGILRLNGRFEAAE